MKKTNFLIVAALAFTGLTTSVSANYFSGMQYDSCCPQSCCNANFNGFYVGGNLGVISHTAYRSDFDFLIASGSDSSIANDFTAGVQLGYDWQWCSGVLGLVVDWNWTNVEHKNRYFPNSTSGAAFFKSDLDWLTTIRGRVGVTFCNALVYFTAGGAVANYETRWFRSTVSPNVEDNFKNTRRPWGWVGGFGTEFLVSCNWSVGAELLFFSFSQYKKTFLAQFGSTTPRNATFGNSDSAWAARFLVNYRFGDLFGSCCW